ncbi:Calcium-activated chloride channel [Phytophthora infestans]|uniref:Calcium-activated chloride channel n=1 Tax=Phytophthora infestans TaxID=4787 RepID=A0A833TGL1_PHYIN|nr:Calcium-activated chloride channel [Phytophthora infestans]
MVNKRTKNRRRASMMSHNLQNTANPLRRHSEASTTKASEVSSAELVVENSQLLPARQRLANDRDVLAMEEGELKHGKKALIMMSPRLDAQLGGYPPDCGTKELKYLSYAKLLRDRGLTHPMRYSNTRVDALGFAMPERFPLFSTDFGAHSFHHLPTDSVVLSPYGLGIALYFKYLKVITWLFFLLMVLSAPTLAVYIMGGGTSMAELTALARQDLPSVLGITSIGHLSEASSVCDQALENTELSLTCSKGEIGFVKAVYSTFDSQGSCSCPQRNKVAESSGECRGDAEGSTCPADGAGCFLGVHPVSLRPCCAFSRNVTTKTPLFYDMRIRETEGCGSNMAQQIVEGLCLGKKTCTLNVSEAVTYAWEPDANFGTNCLKSPTIVTIDSFANITKEVCEVELNDDSDYSKCHANKPRALIVYGRCFTTQIDLSGAWSLKIIGWDSMSRREFLGLAVGSDIACSFAFFMIVIWLRQKEKEAVDHISENQIKALDYTVQLVTLPYHDDLNLLRQEIRLHLEAVLSNAPPFALDLDRVRVADVQFGKSKSRHLRLLSRRGVIVRRLEIAQQRHERLQLLHGRLDERVYARRERRHLRAIHKLEAELHRFNVKLEQWHAHQKRYNISQAVTAFVTFEEEEGFHRCLQEYPDLGWFHRLFQPYYKRLHGKRLRFRPAPDPTDIIWENLHYSFAERVFRQLIVALVTLSVLFLSFVFIFVAKEQKSKLERQFGRPTSCPTEVLKTDVVQDEVNKVSQLVPYKALVECYCKNFLVDHSFRSMMYESFYNPETGEDKILCRSWATTFVTTQVLSIASVLLVVAVNLILARILNALVALEKHHTESSLVVSRVTKVFLAQFCNTALLMLVINANANYFSSSPTVSETTSTGGFSLGVLNLLDGEYSDFSANWYNDVGVALMLTMILNSFSTHVYLLANYFILKAWRFIDRGYSFDHSLTKQDTQRDLEALYRGPKFDLAARYAQSLTSIFITYMFSAGMPLLHFIGFGAMFMTYWADKFTFLRIARSPPLYDSKLATAAGALLPYAVLMHCLMAMWMFSNDRIFESKSDVAFKEATVNSAYSPGDGIPIFDTERGQLFSRVTRPQVVVLFAFFVAGCAIVVLRSLLFEYVPALIRSVVPGLARLLEKPRVAKDLPNYFDALPTSCLQEKLAASGGTQQLLRPDLRAKYERALLNRLTQEDDYPKAATKRSTSDIERFNQANRIIGCPSYAIIDNKEYVAKLAIDSHLSEQIPLDQIF